MATLTVYDQITLFNAGTAMTPLMVAAAGSGGDKWLNVPDDVELLINNTGAAQNVTITGGQTSNFGTLESRTVLCPAGLWILPAFDARRFNAGDGTVTVTFITPANITLVAVHRGRYYRDP